MKSISQHNWRKLALIVAIFAFGSSVGGVASAEPKPSTINSAIVNI